MPAPDPRLGIIPPALRHAGWEFSLPSVSVVVGDHPHYGQVEAMTPRFAFRAAFRAMDLPLPPLSKAAQESWQAAPPDQQQALVQAFAAHGWAGTVQKTALIVARDGTEYRLPSLVEARLLLAVLEREPAAAPAWPTPATDDPPTGSDDPPTGSDGESTGGDDPTDMCYDTGDWQQLLLLWEEPAVDRPPFWYPLIEGITISEYPADRDGDDPARLVAALEGGSTAFIDLTEPGERHAGRPLRRYQRTLQTLARAREQRVQYQRFPVRDLTAPEPAQMRRILDAIDAAREDGHGVLIHCLGGIGRAGTVAGCYLVRHGWMPGRALAHIQAQVNASVKRGRCSPERTHQVDLVQDWAALDWPHS